ncbi:MAG: hypothetical protein U0R17_00670 [Acidimicrobiia bacterium]
MNLSFIRHRFVRIYQSYFPKPLSDSEHQFVRDSLDEQLRSLFYSQPLCDQRHGLLVYQKCNQIFTGANRPKDEELIIASFFHDVLRKIAKLVTQRVVVMLDDFRFYPEKKARKIN